MASKEQIESVLTHDDKYKVRKHRKFFLERELLFAKAFWSLPADAVRVYLIFLNKLVVKRPETRKEKRKWGYVVVNNGQIQFTYKEAKERFGILNKRFGRSIDRLVEAGLIDIAQQGGGMQRTPTLYGVSERWRLFGTTEFEPATRAKRNLHYGFCRPKRKMIPTVENDCVPTVENDCVFLE